MAVDTKQQRTFKKQTNQQVSGYSHKLPVLLDRVARRITSYLQELKGKGNDNPEVRICIFILYVYVFVYLYFSARGVPTPST